MVATLLSLSSPRRTLVSGFSRTGVGLHSGAQTCLVVKPAKPGTGRVFQRIDLPGQPVIPATLASVNPTQLSTELVLGEASIRTVEHVLAALMGMGVDDALLEIDGPEVPLLDGSAQEWVKAIAEVGLTPLANASPDTDPTRTNLPPENPVQLTTALTLQVGEAFVTAIPAETLRFTYGIDFPQAAIGNQWYSLEFTPESFAQEIAPARTFGFAAQIAQLQAMGLIQGGSLENALVCDGEGWVNPPLRFANEPARHKLLDLVGDLSLLGRLPQAHFLAYKASHTLHTQFARQLQAQLQAA
jgi:UDP-3-O-[3-hydroxymyristoyl] N-acetylglucosamine deacetylase